MSRQRRWFDSKQEIPLIDGTLTPPYEDGDEDDDEDGDEDDDDDDDDDDGDDDDDDGDDGDDDDNGDDVHDGVDEDEDNNEDAHAKTLLPGVAGPLLSWNRRVSGEIARWICLSFPTLLLLLSYIYVAWRCVVLTNRIPKCK